MEILNSKEHYQFLAFLPEIKKLPEEWQFVTIQIIDAPRDFAFTIYNVAQSVQLLYQSKAGRIYICNERELILLVKEGINANPKDMAEKIESNLPPGRCEISVKKPTAENIARFQLSIRFDKPATLSEFALQRRARAENVVLIADDDMYMRTLLRKGIDPRFSVQDVIHGSEIIAAYKKFIPDILFLDIHMPGKSGLENLEAVLAFDPQAYVIMVSSDSSPENIAWTTKYGAKGFLSKPFAKENLFKFVQKCPTIN